MKLTREQLNNIRAIKATSAYAHATPLERKALFEATIVESGIRNLHYGDRDSTGILQQRNNGAWGKPNESVQKDVTQFLRAARVKRGQYHDAGALAQAVQVSAFPGRYDQHAAEAAAIVGAGLPAGARSGAAGHVTAGKAPTFTPSSTKVDTHAAVQAALLDHSHQYGGSLAQRIIGAETSGTFTETTPAKITKGVAPKYKLGKSQRASAAATPPKGDGRLATFDGKKVAGWIAPILKRARATGLWHGTVNSGYRSDAEQTRIYDSGVRPAAVPKSEGGSGSNHEGAVYPLGAVDVSDAPGLAAALRKIKAHRLQYAGSKDPVHFSHPHNGGY